MYNQGYQQNTFRAYSPAQALYAPRIYHSQSTPSSPIETIIHRTAAPVQEYNQSKPMQERREATYTSSPLASFTYNQKVESYFPNQGKKEYHATERFLKLYRPKTQFIEA